MKFIGLRPQIAFLGGMLLAVWNPIAAAQQPADASTSSPIAIVPIDSSGSVAGAIQVSEGKAVIANNGTITSGDKPTDVILPRRGTLRVCASTSVKLATDTSVPAGESPGLMMAIDHGSLEASYAAGSNSDILLTPDFRILIGGPGAVDLKIRLGEHGDTCVDNPGVNAPYVLVSSVFEGGAYRVQPGQRVMFQHGSLKEVVDQEKEPCGCPPVARPGTNDFPLAQSAGLAPQTPPVQTAPTPTDSASSAPHIDQALVYQAPAPTEPPPAATPATTAQATPAAAPAPAHPKKRPGFFHRVGSFFRRIFGADQG